MNTASYGAARRRTFLPLRGFSLVELMIAAALSGILAIAVFRLMDHMFTGTRLSVAQLEIEGERRRCNDFLDRHVREGMASTVVLDRADENQPFCSRISFVKTDGGAVSVWQEGTDLKASMGTGTPVVFSSGLHSLNFSFPDPDDAALIHVSFLLEKTVDKKRTKSARCVLRPIRIMNP